MARIDQIKELLNNEPQDSFLNYALALEYAKENELKKAIDIIERIIERDENYLASYYQLAKFYEENTETEKARDAYAKGITIAKLQRNFKTLNELNEAVQLLDE